MTTTKTQNVQDVFLNNVRKNKTPVTIFLVNGVKLQGIVTWFDNFSRAAAPRRAFAARLQACHLDGHAGRADPALRGQGRGGGVRLTHRDERGPSLSRAGDARVLVLSPVLRNAADGPRTAEARLDEAVGLARAIDLEVVHGEVVRLSQPPARRRCSARARSSGSTTLIEAEEIGARGRRPRADAGAAAQSREGLEVQGHRPHRADPRDLRRARPHPRRRLQVELAALTYQRSRLVRSWTHLERQRGGFGFLGGPGESQLEIDRRLIERAHRPASSSELEDVKRTRGLQRKARRARALSRWSPWSATPMPANRPCSTR